MVQAGLKAQARGQLSAAMTDYASASAKDPTNKYAYYDMGVIYQQHNDVADAQNAYHKALLSDANYKPALFNLAILLTASDPAQAISLYRQLLRLNPSDPNVNFNLGLVLISQNEPTEGHADLTRAIQLDPSLKSKLPPGISP